MIVNSMLIGLYGVCCLCAGATSNPYIALPLFIVGGFAAGVAVVRGGE